MSGAVHPTPLARRCRALITLCAALCLGKYTCHGLAHYDDINSNISALPYFEFNVPRNVTTAVGQTAFLHCRVEQLGDKDMIDDLCEKRKLKEWKVEAQDKET
ncbi:uncharacterized protein LOC113382998 [Ctenocephalides felis]|uniref:uncharacterized protein LOC113382998 n=1 Tax=Ctenocephalides felis TaxID=7515 RepID=UPI000E6E1ADB|nr:uncharacterized protein LOC113382998 [Ctenocephalides felis]